MTVCGARMWSYDHWRCQRRRRHLGSHRANNYVGARIPRVWQVRALAHVFKVNQRRKRDYLKPGETKPRLMRYREVLFPDRYVPVDDIHTRVAL